MLEALFQTLRQSPAVKHNCGRPIGALVLNGQGCRSVAPVATQFEVLYRGPGNKEGRMADLKEDQGADMYAGVGDRDYEAITVVAKKSQARTAPVEGFCVFVLAPE